MITQIITNSYKLELLKGNHRLDDNYMIALYSEFGVLNKNTPTYLETMEVKGDGYIAGGKLLIGASVKLDGDSAYLSWNNVVWENSTITARGALIYNQFSKGSVCILDFGEDKFSVNGKFEIEIPEGVISIL